MPFSVPSPCGAAGCCSRFFFPAVLFAAWFPPPCMHAQQHCIATFLGSARCSRPVPPPSCGAALGGPRPCQVGAPPSRHSLLARVVVRLSSFSPLHPPLPSVSCPPSECCSPASCARRWSSPCHGCISRALTRLRASACLPTCRPTWAASPDTPLGGLPLRPLPPAAPPSVP